MWERLFLGRRKPINERLWPNHLAHILDALEKPDGGDSHKVAMLLTTPGTEQDVVIGRPTDHYADTVRDLLRNGETGLYESLDVVFFNQNPLQYEGMETFAECVTGLIRRRDEIVGAITSLEEEIRTGARGYHEIEPEREVRIADVESYFQSLEWKDPLLTWVDKSKSQPELIREWSNDKVGFNKAVKPFLKRLAIEYALRCDIEYFRDVVKGAAPVTLEQVSYVLDTLQRDKRDFLDMFARDENGYKVEMGIPNPCAYTGLLQQAAYWKGHIGEPSTLKAEAPTLDVPIMAPDGEAGTQA